MIALWAAAPPIVATASPSDSPSAADASQQRAAAKALEGERRYGEAVEIYRRYLEVRPEDDEARGALARLLSWQDRFAASEQLYRDILSRHPADAEVRTSLARVLAWQKRFDESRRLYEAVLLDAPEDFEARRGLADVLLWSGHDHEALVAYEQLLLEREDQELAAHVERVKTDIKQSFRAPIGLAQPTLRLPYRDYLKTGYSHYSYTNRVPDERDVLIEGGASIGDKTLVARIEPLNRFGFHDTPVSAELYSPLWTSAWGYVGGQATLNPSFAPNYSAVGELFQGLGPVHSSLSRLELSFGYRRFLFKSTNVDLLMPGLNIYLPFNMWLTEKIYFVPDTGSITLASQLTWRAADRLQFFVSGGFGTSGERITATQDFTRVPSRIFQWGSTFPVSEKLSAEAAGYYEDRGSLYVRRGGTFNLIYHW